MSRLPSDARSILGCVALSAALAACGSSNSGGAGGQSGSSTGGAPGSGGTVSGAGGSGAGGLTSGAGGSGAGTGSGGAATGGTMGTGGSATDGGNGGTGKADAGGTGSGMSAGCGKMPTIPSSQYNNGHHIAITVGSMAREYILNVPTNYDQSHPYKLIIAYHELNGNDDEMFRNQYYHLLPLANNTAIFVAPNGQQNNANCTQAGGCGWPNPNNTDLAFADALVAQIEQTFCVDTDRIFATGWSFGGSMSYKTACERPLGGVANGYIRAIAVYSGSQLSGNCTPTKPVAYYASHGTADAVLCYDQTRTAGCTVGNGVSLAQNFSMANGCTFMTPTKVTSGNHVCTSMTGCMTGYPVEFCSFNGPHTPDPTDPGQRTSWEYQNVWDFLSQF